MTRGFALLLVILLAACAAPEKRRLHFGVDEAPEGKRMLWPQPPEIPRYLYAGTLTGEQNFVGGEQPSGLRRVFDWIVGLAGEPAEPMVLQRPMTGVVDEAGRVYITDVSRAGVFVFDGVGGQLQVWSIAEGRQPFSAPAGIARAADGTLFVADAELGFVARLDAKGAPLGAIGRGVLRRPTGLARDAASGRLFVADTYAHDIKVFGPDGQLQTVLGRRGESAGEFNFPTHLAYADGELYVTDTMNSRVQVIDAASGAARRSVGERGLFVGNLVRPKGVAVDSERNLYVIESYHDHLLIYDRKGQFLMGFGGLGMTTGRFYLPAGVWTDALNRVFIADMFNGRVVVFQFLGGGADGEY